MMGLSTAAGAAQIDESAFASPLVVSYGNPNPTEVVSAPLTVGNATFTSGSSASVLFWQAGTIYQDCIGGCVTTNNFGAGSLTLALSSAYAVAGFYVGQATNYTLSVSFFDASNTLLGTDVVSGTNGTSFAGWQSDAGNIAAILVSNAISNNAVVAVQSGLFQADAPAVPEPATWAMFIGGFGIAGVALRRRRNLAKFA